MIQKRFKLLLAVLAIAFAATGSVKAESWTSRDCTVTLSNDTLYISGDGQTRHYEYIPSIPWYDVRSSIKHAVIGKGVTKIDNCFCDCDQLETVDFEKGSKLKIIEVSAFADCTALTTITLPDSVESIENWAFGRCSSLVSITIPASIKLIKSYTFKDCTNLADIFCYGDPEKLTWENTDAFMPDRGTKVHVLSEDLSKYQEKFYDNINATFVGDLDDNTTKYTLINIPEGWTLTANGRPVTVTNGEAEIPEGANVKLTPATAIINKVKSVTLEDFMPNVTAPTLRTDLVYNGKTQALITAGEVDHGTMLYSADGKTWSNKVPTATNAGDYNIYYKVVPEGHYLGVEPTLIGQASIAKAKGWITLSLSYTTGWDTWSSKNQSITITHHPGGTVICRPVTPDIMSASVYNATSTSCSATITKASGLPGNYGVYFTSVETQNYTAAQALFHCQP